MTTLREAAERLENAVTRARLPSEDRSADILDHAGRVVEALRAARSDPARDHFVTVAAVAASLPVDPEADARVDALFARQPKSAPARDDRGAERRWALEEAARYYDDAEERHCDPIRPRHVAAFLRRLAEQGAASSSGEATALRREGWNAGITAAAEACDGRASAHLLASEPQREARKCANTIRSLVAAPSQETETRGSAPELAACANPYHAKSGCFGRENECYDIRAAIAPAGPRDPASLCGRCVHETTPTSTPGVWVCSYNDARVGNVYSCVGFRPAPAPSAAPDTGSERYCNMCGAVYSGPPEHANESGCQYMAPTLAEIAARASPGAGGADEGSAT
jgi:hypothetical protein